MSINRYADRPPVRAAIPVTDVLTALYGVSGAMLALQARRATGCSQCVDAALYEAAFSLMEAHVPAFDKLGVVPQRPGSRLPGSTPNNLYPVADGGVIAITAPCDAVFRRLAAAIGQPELASDPRFATPFARIAQEDEVDAIIVAWTQEQSADAVETALRAANVPVSRLLELPDVFEDPHCRVRGMVIRAPSDGLGVVALAAPVPRLSATRGSVRWAGR